jgi:hypothetical protein
MKELIAHLLIALSCACALTHHSEPDRPVEPLVIRIQREQRNAV